MHFSLGAKIKGKLASSLQPLLVCWLGFLVFIQATQVQFLGRELDLTSRYHSLLPH